MQRWHLRRRVPLSVCRFRGGCAQSLAGIAVIIFAVTLSAAEPRLRVVTSFSPLYCWTANIVGDLAEVENLLPARAEPHEYAFTPGDARKLGAADLIVVNGFGLEPWLPKFLRSNPSAGERTVTVSTGLDTRFIGGEHDHGHAEHDESAHINPHIWLDPQLAAHGVSNILTALQRFDSTHNAAYSNNAAAYVERLRQLDGDIGQLLAGVTNRSIVTWHDAFPYFARRYGLEIIGVVEEVPDVNPTPKYLTRLRRIMKERGVQVIFVPSGGRSRLARRIATDLHVELAELDTLESGPLTASAYEERMRHNAAVLQKYLK